MNHLVEVPPHGTYRRYVSKRYKCRCDECRVAQNEYQNCRKRDMAYGRLRQVPAIGTVRRLQALMAIGWPSRELAARLGIQHSNLPCHVRYERVRTAFADKVKQLYDELSLVGGTCERTRRRAIADGFLSPEWWDDVDIDDPDALPIEPDTDDEIVDEVAVQRVVSGYADGNTLNNAEKHEAARVMSARGIDITVLASRLHWSNSKARQILEEAS